MAGWRDVGVHVTSVRRQNYFCARECSCTHEDVSNGGDDNAHACL